MTIEWGPEIPVDGKRPEWLADDVRVVPKVEGSPYEPLWPRHASAHNWSAATTHIRLPADHPHYQQADADTVTIKRISLREFEALFEAMGWQPALEYLGYAWDDRSDLDRFMAAHPTADRETAEKALVWDRS